MSIIDNSDYINAGYDDRASYLKGLAEEHSLPLEQVQNIADLFGSSEDFDGLVTTLEDLETHNESVNW